jgi:hypothetical protein
MWIEMASALQMASSIDGLNPPDTSATNIMKIRVSFGSLRRRTGGGGGGGEGGEGGRGGEGGGEGGGGGGEGGGGEE